MSDQLIDDAIPAQQVDHPRTTDDDDSDLGTAGAALLQSRPRSLGLWLAPMAIAGLCLLLYRYYQGLDLANATIQQRSALDWSEKLVPQIRQQFTISLWSTILVVLIAVPLGILLTRDRFRRRSGAPRTPRPDLTWTRPTVLGIANAGQAIPAYGLLILFLALSGQGQTTAIWALVFYAILPVLRNTMVGLDNVDRSTIEAGRGMGMTKWQVLTKIELPLAVPVILAGVRVAMIINIGMATLAFLIGGGGLGITINSGLKLQQDPVILVGGALVAIMALTFDWVGAVAERYLRPRGL